MNNKEIKRTFAYKISKFPHSLGITTDKCVIFWTNPLSYITSFANKQELCILNCGQIRRHHNRRLQNRNTTINNCKEKKA